MKTKMMILSLLVPVLGYSAVAEAAPKKRPTPRDAEVKSVKDAYWNRTVEGDVEVVQNRSYSKVGRISIQAGGGTVSTDPFLSVRSASAALGYHFSESWGVNVVGRKYFVSDSNYRDNLSTGLVTGASSASNVNRPSSFLGGEIEYSPLYGKISLSGKSIVHYDAHLLLGAGVTETETGRLLTPSIGLGPQFYLSRSLALRMDYRATFYKESIPETVLQNASPTAGTRNNFSHLVSLGMIFFL